MKVNKIAIKERALPSHADFVARLRDRLQVKVEQEIRHLSPSDRMLYVDRYIPAVEARGERGRPPRPRRDRWQLLRDHKPETAVREGDDEANPAPAPRPSGGARSDDEAASRAPGDQPRRRRRSGGGGGGRGPR
jgi:hypothetical protein